MVYTRQVPANKRYCHTFTTWGSGEYYPYPKPRARNLQSHPAASKIDKLNAAANLSSSSPPPVAGDGSDFAQASHSLGWPIAPRLIRSSRQRRRTKYPSRPRRPGRLCSRRKASRPRRPRRRRARIYPSPPARPRKPRVRDRYHRGSRTPRQRTGPAGSQVKARRRRNPRRRAPRRGPYHRSTRSYLLVARHNPAPPQQP